MNRIFLATAAFFSFAASADQIVRIQNIKILDREGSKITVESTVVVPMVPPSSLKEIYLCQFDNEDLSKIPVDLKETADMAREQQKEVELIFRQTRLCVADIEILGTFGDLPGLSPQK